MPDDLAGGSSTTPSVPAASPAPVSSTSPSAPSQTSADPGTSPGSSEQVGSPDTTAIASRPPTALAALEKAAQSAEAATTPESATATPAAPGTTPRNEAPLSRIEAAVRNARDKERAQIESEIGWARQYSDVQEVHTAVDRWTRMNADPVGFLTALAQEIGYVVAPANGNGNQPDPQRSAPPQELVDPEPDLQAQDGTRAYSAKAYQQLMTNALERQKRDLMKLVEPALQYANEGRQTALQQAQTAEAQKYARESFDIVSKLPHFDLAGVRQAFLAIKPDIRARLGGHGSLMTAYHNYLAQHVLPTLSQRQEQQTYEDLRRSAVAGGSVAPASTASAAKKPRIKDGDVDGLAAHLAKLYGDAQAT